jgi:adenine-specific DNA-methyltransferase
VSTLNDLLYQLRAKEPELAKDLEREVTALAERRAFGLNFERHVPEVVELPGRKVRKGDKVRILSRRGRLPTKSDETLWRVLAIDRTTAMASLELLDTLAEDDQLPVTETEVAFGDLVVVAEFRDPIYPGLVSTGKVERGGDRPFHTVINAENFHALEMLLFTHRGKVDAIYIDPPYNTGARDWKYNNDYVEGDDLYRHSKWLAFMERRLLLAKELLNPNDSVLIVTIDEKEYLRLGLLLEQTFPGAELQMISTVISQKGSARTGEFSRCNEFIYFVSVGSAQPIPQATDMLHGRVTEVGHEVEWGRLTRNGANGRRTARPNLHYPIFFKEDGSYHSTGDPLPIGDSRETVSAPPGTVAVFPTATDGTEMSWGLSRDRFVENVRRGYVKFGGLRVDAPQPVRIYYLTDGYVQAAERGDIIRADGDLARWLHTSIKGMKPLTVWNMASHNAAEGGTNLLKKLVPDRRFPFPKSLYAVEDALRFFVAGKPDAVVLDFFAGSGTTNHAVMRLNRQDGGQRRSIMITNNEVASDEQRSLCAKRLRPGDSEWEQWGICEHITKPRIGAAITGRTSDGEPIKGDYKFTDEFPMAEGFEENVEFFTLTYETPLRVASNRDFTKIAPLLWLRAGSRGRRIDDISAGWDVAETYGVLADLDQTEDFLKAIADAADDLSIAFIVTDEDRLFESVARELPDHVEPVRLYEAYLRNFEIESGRGAL